MYQQLALEMKETALANPHNQERKVIAPEVCHRVVEVDGVRVNVMLTYNLWDSIPVRCWQLSLSREDYAGLLDDKRAMSIVEALLGEGAEELTSMMPAMARPDIIRQWMKRI
jgi:hypothetical protein